MNSLGLNVQAILYSFHVCDLNPMISVLMINYLVNNKLNPYVISCEPFHINTLYFDPHNSSGDCD